MAPDEYHNSIHKVRSEAVESLGYVVSLIVRECDEKGHGYGDRKVRVMW